LTGLLGREGIVELYPLSTCNRTEFYLVHGEESQPAVLVGEFLREISGGSFQPAEHADELTDLDAATHLLEVAAGLDSMVMGEPQILGQVKEAYEKARRAKLFGTVLDRLLQIAFKAGKRAREETDIGMGAVSVSFAAVELARKIFGHLEHKVATLIGVGEMGTLCARHLQGAGIHRLHLVNRTYERSVELAGELEGQPVPIEQLYPTLAQSDIVISSTAAPGFVIQAEPFRAQAALRRRECLLVDIAIPRDIEPSVGDLPGVFLYDIDDLTGIVDANLRKRQFEAEKVRRILDEELQLFIRWLESLGVKPTIIALRQKLEDIRQQELGGLKNLTERERELVDRATRGYMNKVLHPPVTNLREATSDEEKIAFSHALNRLFQLEPPTPPKGEKDDDD
jgi:glutamyl-tRNA reductase